jgi:hypothetical protein
MVYVLDINGKPLMPTCRHGKIKHLLKNGKAKVIKTGGKTHGFNRWMKARIS